MAAAEAWQGGEAGASGEEGAASLRTHTAVAKRRVRVFIEIQIRPSIFGFPAPGEFQGGTQKGFLSFVPGCGA